MREGHLCCKSLKLGGKRSGYSSITTSTPTKPSIQISHSIPGPWLCNHSFLYLSPIDSSPPRNLQLHQENHLFVTGLFYMPPKRFHLHANQFIIITKTEFIICLTKLSTFPYSNITHLWQSSSTVFSLFQPHPIANWESHFVNSVTLIAIKSIPLSSSHYQRSGWEPHH